jgi:hypothetical protein
MRKTIQIAVIPSEDPDCCPVLIALCNDGTLWTAVFDQDYSLLDWKCKNSPPSEG